MDPTGFFVVMLYLYINSMKVTHQTYILNTKNTIKYARPEAYMHSIVSLSMPY